MANIGITYIIQIYQRRQILTRTFLPRRSGRAMLGAKGGANN